MRIRWWLDAGESAEVEYGVTGRMSSVKGFVEG